MTSILSPRVIRQEARRLGVVRRERKIDVVALVQVLVLGFSGARRRTIAGFRRAYELATGVTLAPSAFYGRLTPALAELLRELTLRAFDQLGENARRMHLALSADAGRPGAHLRRSQRYPGLSEEPAEISPTGDSGTTIGALT